MKHWEIIADNLSKSGFSWGVMSAVTQEGKTLFIADARSADNKALYCASG